MNTRRNITKPAKYQDFLEYDSESDEESFSDDDESDPYGSDSSEGENDVEDETDNTAVVDQENNDNQIWYSDIVDIKQFPFSKDNSGIQNNIVNENSTPRDAFDALFGVDVLDHLVRAVNEYGNSLYDSKPLAKWVEFKDTTREEMQKFLGLCLLQGQTKCPTIRKLFSKHPLYYRPVFSATMSGRRFETILRCFNTHSDPDISSEQSSADRLTKVRPLLDMMIKRFSEAYVPDKELSLDESLLLWRGRLMFRVYNQRKSAKYGVLFYELTTSDGYVLNIEIYQGSDPQKPQEGKKTEKIVLRLMNPYLDRGHHLFMDNFYNSVSLSTLLLTRNTHTTGTLRSNRKNNPKDVVSAKLKRGQYIWKRSGDIYVTKWKDKRDVLTLSTAHHPKLVEVKNRYGEKKMKPADVASYNDHMSGVDRADQMTSYYSSPRKTIRWYKKVLFHLLDVSVWNAFYMYRKFHPKTSFLYFRDLLITSLIELPTDVREGKQLIVLSKSTPGRPISKTLPSPTRSNPGQNEHILEKIPPPIHWKRKSYFLRCRECTRNNIRRQTSYRCKICADKPPLCVTCFGSFHKL